MPRRTVWLALLWTLFVLYPNPSRLVVAAVHAWSPVVDPQAVTHMAAALPDDPQVIEAAVESTLVPYAVPWETYGVPWYFPTPAEVLARGQGDCQARAVVLASILEAKGIPFKFVGSFDHLWIEYPKKQATPLERAEVAIVAQQPNGRYRFQWPQLVEWQRSWEIERAYFWDAMPGGRLWLLIGGWLLIGWRGRGTRRVAAGVRRRWGKQAGAASQGRAS